MNTKLLLSTAIAGLIVLSSCKKDKNDPVPQPNPVPDYAVLKVGSYWVYDTYYSDSNGVETLTGQRDSVFVEKDTVINGKTYYKKVVVSMVNPSISYWREEGGKLVNHLGNFLPDKEGVLGSRTELMNNDTLFTATSTLLANETPVTTPAGTFTVKTIEHVYKIYDKQQAGYSYRYKNTYSKYHPTLGDIERTYFYMSPTSFQYNYIVRLTKYHIN
ncbi:MAG: hypothetical protein F9K23_10165 [Bacteroidetes bacterium]|nr:MAG: hypothetical protein F9K23_10165 [Bacteroidota bacterium]